VDKRRIINTRFWDDVYIAGLSPREKLVFLYLISSPLTNISGVYELPVKRAALDVSLEIAEVEAILTKFEEDGKVARFKGWLGVTNFIAHQTLNPKIIQGILNGLRKAPKEVVDRLCIDFQRLFGDFRGISILIGGHPVSFKAHRHLVRRDFEGDRMRVGAWCGARSPSDGLGGLI
jgi:hypothetical protein